jgi:hypothetical protein
MCISGDDTQHFASPNLRKNLGRNAPQFRTALGLIRARARNRAADKRRLQGNRGSVGAAMKTIARAARTPW